MFVKSVSLRNFRNYEHLEAAFGEGVNIFYGDNAQGKTNLLEAVYYCATGHSLRAGADRELIRFSETEAHTRLITGRLAESGAATYADKIDVHLRKDAPKGVAVNGVPLTRLSMLFGVLLAVVFSPEDLGLVKAGPAARRRFVDMELCQVSRVYCHDLQQYTRALKQRNNLLKAAKGGRAAMAEALDTLSLWDEQLVTHGAKLIAHRRAFAEELALHAAGLHGKITKGRERLDIVYRPNVTEEDFAEKLRKSAARDMALGVTGAGAHKDDLAFLINGVDARAYGSQGQQRTAALSVKLSELAIIRARTGRSPVLLLDDVLSELDESRAAFLMECVAGGQSMITCTGLEGLARGAPPGSRVYRVEKGRIWD